MLPCARAPTCEEDENPNLKQEVRAANELLEVDDDITAQLGGGGTVRATRWP